MKTFLRVPTSVVLAAAMGLPGAIHAHDAGDDSPPLSAGAAFRDERAGMQHVLSAEQLDRLRGKAARAHKPYDQPMQAAAFFVKQRVSGGAESIDPLLYEAAKRQAEQLPLFSSALGRVLDGAESETPVRAALDQWTALGPGNVGGRTRVLKFRPGTPSTMYTGGVAGGTLDGFGCELDTSGRPRAEHCGDRHGDRSARAGPDVRGYRRRLVQCRRRAGRRHLPEP